MRDPEQRRRALERANEVRMQRSRLKKDLQAGRVSIIALLSAPPDYLATAKVADMLLPLPKYGRVQVAKALKECDIPPGKTIGDLSERQRLALITYLRRRGG